MLFIKKMWKAYRQHRCKRGYHVWEEDKRKGPASIVNCKHCPAAYIKLRHRAF